MKQMRTSANVEFEIHAYGKPNVGLCKLVCLQLGKWIEVSHIETGVTQIDKKCYIVVFCRQGAEFVESFRKNMEKAKEYKKKKKLYRQEMMSDDSESSPI